MDENVTYGELAAASDSSAGLEEAMPEPGTVCPTCGERTPNEKALKMRAWRKKRKGKG